MADFDKYYDGSRIFSWLSDLSGLPLDQVNFIISQLLALACAPIFRNTLHPSTTSPTARHAFGLVLGLAFGYFCFGILVSFVTITPCVASQQVIPKASNSPGWSSCTLLCFHENPGPSYHAEIEGTPLGQSPREVDSVFQLVKKFPVFYGTQLLITVFTRAYHCTLPLVR